MKSIKNFFSSLFGSVKGNELFFKGITTLILAAGAVVIMIPLAFMISTSLKDPAQIRSDANTLIPRKPQTVEINGEIQSLSSDIGWHHP
jgi:ABC-type glycerol-3-phosphate transport system permease component